MIMTPAFTMTLTRPVHQMYQKYRMVHKLTLKWLCSHNHIRALSTWLQLSQWLQLNLSKLNPIQPSSHSQLHQIPHGYCFGTFYGICSSPLSGRSGTGVTKKAANKHQNKNQWERGIPITNYNLLLVILPTRTSFCWSLLGESSALM